MIYAFFPIVAAILYGLGFSLMDRALQVTNVITFMLVDLLIAIPLILALIKISGEPLSWEFLNNKTDIAILVAAVAIPTIGWFLTAYTVKNISAGYAAFAEVSYPLFTIIFLFLIFGIRNFDWHLLLGGMLVVTGSFILVLGQLSKSG